MMKLLVKTAKSPVVTFEPNNATVTATATVTAYAIQPNATLSPLFVLNLVGYTAQHDKEKHLCVSEEKVTHHVVVLTGDQCQRQSVCQWSEAGRSCHPEQVSY